MTFSLHKGGVVVSSQIILTQNFSKHTPLRPYSCHLLLDFHLLRCFYSLSQPYHVTTSLPSPGDNHHCSEGLSESTQGQAKMPRETHSVTYVPGLSTLSGLSRIGAQPPPSFLCCLRPPSHHPSSQPNLCLPRTRQPLTSATNTLLAIRYSSILSTCPNHLDIHWSALLVNSLPILALIRTSSFITLSICGTPTKLLKHFISRAFTFFQHFSYPHACAPYNAVGTITPSYRVIDTSLPLSPVLYCSAHFSELPTLYTPHSFCVPHPFHNYYSLINTLGNLP